MPDLRLNRALAVAVWGVMNAKKISLAAIGRAMRGPFDAAGQIKRVWRLCKNEKFSPMAVQASLIHWLVGVALPPLGNTLRQALVAIDWVDFDNGRIKALRVSLITGSRALPILWYEVLASEMKRYQTEIQRRAIQDLVLHRPSHVKWVMLLDAGFNSSELFDLLDLAGSYVVRSTTKRLVHSSTYCWLPIGKLPIRVGQLVEFGWVHHSASNARQVRLVLARLYEGPKPKRTSRRASNKHYKYSMPGLCAVVTNLPMDEYSAQAIIRLYARRFEIEHHFRDLKNASLGMDMGHVHLLETQIYSRLMCIVAVAEACLWLSGAELEARGLDLNLTTSRPKRPRRHLSLRNTAREYLGLISVPVETLIAERLRPALLESPYVVSRSWKDAKQKLDLNDLAPTRAELAPLPPRCRHRGRGSHRVCQRHPLWKLVPAATRHEATARLAA